MKKFISILIITALIVMLSFVMLMSLTQNTYASTETSIISRGDWIKELVATFDMSVDEDNYPDSYFKDLSKESTYYYDVMVATEFGVMDVEAGEEVHPEDATTREFAAHTLNYCLGFELEEKKYTYSDQCTYKEDMQIAINRGWFSLSNGNVIPNQAITEKEKETMFNDAKAVLKSSQLDSSFDNKYTFAKGVIQVSEYAEIAENNVVTIEGLTEKISVGDTFVVFSDGFPVVYVAKKITTNGTKTIIETSEANKEEAIISVQEQGDTNISIADFEPSEGVTAEVIKSEQRAKALSLKKGVSISKDSIVADKEIKLSNGIKTKVSLNLSDLKIKHKVDTIGGNYNITVSGKSTLTGNVSLDVIAETLGSKTIQFGEIRIWGVGVIKVAVELELNGKVTVTYVGNFEAGLQYTRTGGFRLVKTFKKTKFSSVIEATAKIGIKVECGVDVIAAKATIYATTGIKAKYVSEAYNDGKRPGICTQISGWLYATVGANATLGLSPLQKSFGKEIDIYSFSNSPVRLSYHYEDGQKVKSCTRGKDYKYLTAEDSRYGICSFGDACSTGYDSNGNPIVIYTYELNDAGNAIITGYKGFSSILAIPSEIDGHKVVEIGRTAFLYNTNITYVIIPSTVEKINTYAFKSCSNITDVIFEDGLLTKIDTYAFEECSSLRNVTIPDTVDVIECGAFKNCTNLKTIYLPKNIKTGDYATEKAYPGPFYGCLKLRNVTFGEGTTIINKGIFQYAGMEEITIPENVTKIADKAFYDCVNLKKINWNKKLTTIGREAFAYCLALEEAILPNSVTSLGVGAFRENSLLKKAYIPKNTVPGSYILENIQYPAIFHNCWDLETVEFGTGTKIIRTGILGYTGIKDFVIPNTVTTVEPKAFYNCKYLENVTIPTSVTKIGNSAFRYSGLKELVIPNTVTSLGTYVAGNNDNLTKITLPNTLTNIPAGTCYQCKSLKEITLPEKVTEINKCAFQECETLEKINWSKELKYIDGNSFHKCNSIKEFNIPNTVLEIDDFAFYDSDNLTKVIIPNSVTYLGKYVFYDCDKLQDVSLGNGITVINESLFEHCDSLKEIKIPNKVTSINKNAFKDCIDFVKITIPPATTYIAETAFSYPDLITIVGIKGSYVETFAKENGFTFEETTENLSDETGGNNDGKPNQGNEGETTHEHKYTKNVISPTCTKKGYTIYKCTGCGHSYTSDYTDTIEHKIVEDSLIKATISKDGKEAGTHCLVCNKVLSGNKTIDKIKSVDLSKTTYVYDEKAKKPNVIVKDSKENIISSKYYTIKYINNKNTGKATVKVTFKDKYSGTITKYFTIKPKAAKLTSVKSKKSKQLTIVWKKDTLVTGYEVQVATNNKFTKNKIIVNIKKNKTTSTKISKLKSKKKYYARVREYKVIDGKKFYGSWSNVKSTKTKR